MIMKIRIYHILMALSILALLAALWLGWVRLVLALACLGHKGDPKPWAVDDFGLPGDVGGP
jgi:hypothetical protein